MNNHLNAIKEFFVYLYKEGIADNIFNKIADYDAFRFEVNIDEESNISEMINREISKFQFYQNIFIMIF